MLRWRYIQKRRVNKWLEKISQALAGWLAHFNSYEPRKSKCLFSDVDKAASAFYQSRSSKRNSILLCSPAWASALAIKYAEACGMARTKFEATEIPDRRRSHRTYFGKEANWMNFSQSCRKIGVGCQTYHILSIKTIFTVLKLNYDVSLVENFKKMVDSYDTWVYSMRLCD